MNDPTQKISTAITGCGMPSGMILNDTETIVLIRDTARRTLYANTRFDKPFDPDRENAVCHTGKPDICIEQIHVDNDQLSFLTIYFPVKNDEQINGVGMIGIPVSGSLQNKPSAEPYMSAIKDANDFQTGIRSPSFIMSKLEKEIVRSEQHGQPTTIVLMNIDRFAKLNEEWGQGTIRTILGEFCELIKGHLRSTDLFGRWGEKEFVLLLPDTGLVTGQQIAERIRSAIDHRQFHEAGQVTASFGIATHQVKESLEDFIKRADAAVFKAKVSGKNRVELKAGHFLKLLWKHEYECGHPVIDEQHRYLFSRANQLLYAIFDNQPQNKIVLLIHQLLEHIQRHFEEEERILATSGYMQTEEHACIHRRLISKASLYVARFEKNELDFDEIFSFFVDNIVIEHMQKEDRKFFSFLSMVQN